MMRFKDGELIRIRGVLFEVGFVDTNISFPNNPKWKEPVLRKFNFDASCFGHKSMPSCTGTLFYLKRLADDVFGKKHGR